MDDPEQDLRLDRLGPGSQSVTDGVPYRTRISKGPPPQKNYAGFAFDNGDRLYSFCIVDTPNPPKQAKRQKIDGMKILIKTKD